MIDVSNKVKVYEQDGKPQHVGGPVIEVLSHWNYDDRVTLVVDGKTHTVLAKDMLAAIQNATNTARF